MIREYTREPRSFNPLVPGSNPGGVTTRKPHSDAETSRYDIVGVVSICVVDPRVDPKTRKSTPEAACTRRVRRSLGDAPMASLGAAFTRGGVYRGLFSAENRSIRSNWVENPVTARKSGGPKWFFTGPEQGQMDRNCGPPDRISTHVRAVPAKRRPRLGSEPSGAVAPLSGSGYEMSLPEEARSWAEGAQPAPRCEAEDTAPCDVLINDPVAAIRDRSRWPTHICGEVQRALVDRWKQHRSIQLFGHQSVNDVPGWDRDPGEWMDAFPEVGAETYRSWLRADLQAGRIRVPELQQALRYAVREKPATLLVPLIIGVGETEIVFLGLGKWPARRGDVERDAEGTITSYLLPRPSEAIFQVSGALFDVEVLGTADAMSEWWRSLYDKDITKPVRGRPRKQETLTMSQAILAREQCREDHRSAVKRWKATDKVPAWMLRGSSGDLSQELTQELFMNWYLEVGIPVHDLPKMERKTLERRLVSLKRSGWTV